MIGLDKKLQKFSVAGQQQRASLTTFCIGFDKGNAIPCLVDILKSKGFTNPDKKGGLWMNWWLGTFILADLPPMKTNGVR